MKNYAFRNARSIDDCEKMKVLFNEVFSPEKVGDLTENFYKFLPQMDNNNWFLAEEKSTSKIVSACALIPWKWNYCEIKLKVAEMGIVATDLGHRNKGLMNRLFENADKKIESDDYDISVIQGIPGFYHKFGYYYALAFENHINIPLHLITKFKKSVIRKAELSDIEFLMKEDEKSESFLDISINRSKKDWEYLLLNTKGTDYEGEFYIIENNSEKYYFKINLKGFSKGLILSEMSFGVTIEAVKSTLSYCKYLCEERSKPFIRINLDTSFPIAKYAISAGVSLSSQWGWQIKISNIVNFIKKISAVLEKRMKNSLFRNYTGVYVINLYNKEIGIAFKNGSIIEVEYSPENKDLEICIREDSLNSLIMGLKSYSELNRLRPDTFCYDDCMDINIDSGMLTEILFPKLTGWVYCRY